MSMELEKLKECVGLPASLIGKVRYATPSILLMDGGTSSSPRITSAASVLTPTAPSDMTGFKKTQLTMDSRPTSASPPIAGSKKEI